MNEIQYKEINISKKLLSEVFEISKQIINKVYINYNKIIICFYAALTGGIKEIEINIYELANKYKIWAFRFEYLIESYYEAYYYDNKSYEIVKVFFDGDEVWNNYSNKYIDIWHI